MKGRTDRQKLPKRENQRKEEPTILRHQQNKKSAILLIAEDSVLIRF
jgi:hypothetical protein